MGWGAQSWLRLVPETVFATFDASRVAAESVWIRLASDTAFNMLPEPQRHEIMSADGGNRPVQNVSSRTKVAGSLKTLLYPTQASALLTWATVFASNDLNSYTADHYDSFEARRYLGVKVGTLDIESSAESNEGILMANFGLVAQKPDSVAPTLTQPAFSVFPAENPYVFQESVGGFTVGAVRTKYNAFKMSLKNVLAAVFDESQYVSGITYCGRTIDFSSNFQYVSATDKTNYEAQTGTTCSIVFTKVSPAHTLTLDFKASGRYTKRDRQTPLGNISRQAIDFRTFYDSGASTDLGFVST